MITVQKAIEALKTLPEAWTLHMDSVANICISNERNQIVGTFDVATGEIDRWDDSISP